MFEIYVECCSCGSSGEVDDITNLDGCCPNYHSHHGEVMYNSECTVEDFIQKLSKLSEREIAKYSVAISVCANDLLDKM